MLAAIREFMDAAGYLDTVAGALALTLWLWSKARRHRLRDFIRHYVIGNDRPPLAIAFVRALIGAVILGGAAALNAWDGNTSPEFIIRAGLAAGVGFLMLRGAVEGWIDTGKGGKK